MRMSAPVVVIEQSEPSALAGRLAPSPAAGAGTTTARRMWMRGQIRIVTGFYVGLLRLLQRCMPGPRPWPASGVEVLLTGTFHSQNWVAAHVKPLARSRACKRVRIVTTNVVPELAKVDAIYPPRWLVSTIGRAPARLLVFALVAIRTRPDVIGGFHLLFNGMASVILARCLRARSMYFCVGGPAEVVGGGVLSENRFFDRLGTPDSLVERRLIEAVAAHDLVITMGTSAAQYFHRHGITTPVHVVSGGIDAQVFDAVTDQASYDLVFVGRLAPIKRVDILIRAVAELARMRPAVRAVIVGDGAQNDQLRALARDLGVAGQITFAGHQRRVAPFLRQSKVFVLTSETEGLALSLMEAMMCGLPAVVPRVGDLGDLVVDGVNGYMVSDSDPRTYAARIAVLLNDESRYARFSTAARDAARPYETAAAVRRWDGVLMGSTSTTRRASTRVAAAMKGEL
jgi:glycosyltransferase involved in cell wall biosynthesis